MELGHSQIQKVNSFACLLRASVLDIQSAPVTGAADASNVWLLCASFPAGAVFFLWPSEATFQARPLATWGPRRGQGPSNAGIVLGAQHAFSLPAARHGTSKPSFIPRSWTHQTGCIRQRVHRLFRIVCENVISVQRFSGTLGNPGTWI